MLQRVAPALTLLKEDALRLVYTYGIGHIAEAILAARNMKSDQTVGDDCTTQLVVAYQILSQQWIKLNKTVAGASAEAAAQVLVVLKAPTFETEGALLMPSLLALYRKSDDPLPITSAISILLEQMTRLKLATSYLEAHTNPLLLALFPMISAISSGDDPNAMKNHNKALRCFETITRLRPDFPISFALQKLSVRSAGERLGALTLLRHLIQHVDTELHRHKVALVSKMITMMSDADLNIRKAVAQTMISMASMEYLDPGSSSTLLEFCVQYASVSDEEVKEYEHKNRVGGGLLHELRTMCERILDLISRSIPAMEDGMWSYLLSSILQAPKSGSCAVCCKCLVNITHRRDEAGLPPLALSFGTGEIPSKEALTCRLLSLLVSPLKRNKLGKWVLALMGQLGAEIDPGVGSLWSSAVGQLATYIDSHDTVKNFKQTFWEEQLIRLFSATVEVVKDEKWIGTLGNELALQLTIFKDDVAMKGTLHKYLGVLLRKVKDDDYVQGKLDHMFNVSVHTNEIDQQGLAQGYGFCATVHFEQVMGKIGMVMKDGLVTQSRGVFFGLGSTKGEHPQASWMRSSLLLCFGWITVYSSGDCSSVADQVIRPMLSMVPDFTTLHLRLSAMKAIDIMGKALNAAQTQNKFIIDTRDELLDVIANEISTIPQPGRSSESSVLLRLTGVQAATRLVLLEPTVSLDQTTMLLEIVAAFYDIEDSTGSLMSGVCNLHAALLQKSCNVALLQSILDSLRSRMSSVEQMHRTRAVSTVPFLLRRLLESAASDTAGVGDLEGSFKNVGSWAGILIPRLVDPVQKVRTAAAEAMGLLFHADTTLRSRHTGDTISLNEDGGRIKTILEALPEDDDEAKVASMKAAVDVVSEFVHVDSLGGYLEQLITGLSDWDVDGARCCGLALSAVLGSRRVDLKETIEVTLTGSLDALESLEREDIIGEVLGGLAWAASGYLEETTKHLLKESLPLRPVSELLLQQVLCQGNDVVKSVMNKFMDVIGQCEVALPEAKEVAAHEEASVHPESSAEAAEEQAQDIVEPNPSVATALIKRCMAQTECLSGYIIDHTPALLHMLTMRLGGASEDGAGEAEVQDAMEALSLLISALGYSSSIREAIESRAIDLCGGYPDGIAEIVASICDEASSVSIQEWGGILAVKLAEGKRCKLRVTRIAVTGSIMHRCVQNQQVLKSMLGSLLEFAVSDDGAERRAAFKALRSCMLLQKEHMQDYTSKLVQTFFNGLEDTCADVASDSCGILLHILEQNCLEKTAVAEVVPIGDLLKTALEMSKRADLRDTGLRMFTSLCHTLDGAQNSEVLKAMLLPIMVYVADPSEAVQSACMSALLALSSHLSGSTTCITDRIQKESQSASEPFGFLSEMSVILVELGSSEYTYQCLKVCHDVITEGDGPMRAGAITVGAAMSTRLRQKKDGKLEIDPERAPLIEVLFADTVSALNDGDVTVRRSATRALSAMQFVVGS